MLIESRKLIGVAAFLLHENPGKELEELEASLKALTKVADCPDTVEVLALVGSVNRCIKERKW